MKKLCIAIITVLGAPCFASHHTLTIKERVEYMQKRITLLKSQRDGLKLQKKDSQLVDADIALAENSLKALLSQH